MIAQNNAKIMQALQHAMTAKFKNLDEYEAEQRLKISIKEKLQFSSLLSQKEQILRECILKQEQSEFKKITEQEHEELCPVCLCEIKSVGCESGGKLKSGKAKHYAACSGCLSKLSNQCPICRGRISANEPLKEEVCSLQPYDYEDDEDYTVSYSPTYSRSTTSNDSPPFPAEW